MAQHNSSHIKTHLVSVLGAGGVGKTTSSAALALALADEGLKTVVITVDPARRLATALGLDSLNSEPQRVYVSDKGGFTDALWLSQTHGLSELVNRRLSSSSSFSEVKNHRLFKIIESQLGGIEEYLGIERILSLAQTNLYDVCILDTPPSRHALDFFASPRHILKFFDDGVLKHFIKEEHSGAENKESSFGFFRKIIQKRGTQAFDIFKNFLGSNFVDELSVLLSQLKPVRELLRETATSIESWLESDKSSIVFCATTEDYALREIDFLSAEIKKKNFNKPELLLINRCISTNLNAQDLSKFAKDHPNLISASQLSLKYLAQTQKLNQSQNVFETWANAVATAPRLFFEENSLDHLKQLGRTVLQQWPNNPVKKASTIY